MDIPTVSVEQMVAVDRVAPEQYGITVSRMMENAGHQIASFVRQELDGESVHVYAGTGNNGGDGLVAARRLHCWGYDVAVTLASDELDGIREEEQQILERLGVAFVDRPEQEPDVVIDALIGYSLEGAPRPPFDDMIDDVNSVDATVVSIDVPSGVDADTGEAAQPHVAADHTVTLALPFDGFARTEATGEVWVADIAVPPETYTHIGVDPGKVEAMFRDSSLVPMQGRMRSRS